MVIELSGAEPIHDHAERPIGRRLDWRFLLPTPLPGPVRLVGRPLATEPDPALREAVAVLGDGGLDPAAPPVVVLRDPRPDFVALANLVRSGGTLVLEHRRGLDPRGILGRNAPRDWVRGLRDAGFESVQAYWVWPSFEGCLEVTPLFDRGALRMSIARRSGRRGARLRAALATVAVRLGLFPRIAPSVATVATRSSPASPGRAADPPLGAVTAELVRHRDRLALSEVGLAGPPSGMLLTPRFDASHHVILLVTARGEAHPRVVAKLHRRPAPSEGLAREGANLAALERLELPRGSVPRLLGWIEVADHPVLVETALAGRAVDPNEIRRDRAGVISMVETGLRRLVLDRWEALSAGRHEREIQAAIVRLRAAFPPDADADLRRLAAAAGVLEPLAGERLPVVFEHGDLAHPNVLRTPDGGLGLIDWELGVPDGLPLQDLVFSLAHVAFAVDRPATDLGHAQAVMRAFDHDSGWAAAILDRHAKAIGVDPRLVRPLVVATWTRYLAGRAARLSGAAPAGRYLEIWRAVVDESTSARPA